MSAHHQPVSAYGSVSGASSHSGSASSVRGAPRGRRIVLQKAGREVRSRRSHRPAEAREAQVGHAGRLPQSGRHERKTRHSGSQDPGRLPGGGCQGDVGARGGQTGRKRGDGVARRMPLQEGHVEELCAMGPCRGRGPRGLRGRENMVREAASTAREESIWRSAGKCGVRRCVPRTDDGTPSRSDGAARSVQSRGAETPAKRSIGAWPLHPTVCGRKNQTGARRAADEADTPGTLGIARGTRRIRQLRHLRLVAALGPQRIRPGLRRAGRSVSHRLRDECGGPSDGAAAAALARGTRRGRPGRDNPGVRRHDPAGITSPRRDGPRR